MTWLRVAQRSLADAPAGSVAVEAWLVFWPLELDRRYWWTPWVDPLHAHVSVFKQDGDRWLALDHRLDYLDLRVVGPGWATLEEVLPAGWTVAVKATGWREQYRLRVPWLLAPFTCVEVVKHLLGVRGWWPVTPKQLLESLKRDGRITMVKQPRIT